MTVSEPAKSTNALPVVEERPRIEKRTVTHGTVRVETRTASMEQHVYEQLTSDEIEIERIAVGCDLDEMPLIRTEGNVTIVPVVREELRIEKRLVLVEEIHLRRRIRTETVDVPIEVRRQDVVVTRVPTDSQTD